MLFFAFVPKYRNADPKNNQSNPPEGPELKNFITHSM